MLSTEKAKIPMSIVNYKPIKDYPGYRVGDDGTVWSCLKRKGIKPAVIGTVWKKRKARLDQNKIYLKVGLYKNGVCKHFLIQRLILEAFVGQCPEGMEACHFPNRDPTNNNLSNLRWDTPANNHLDKIAQGTWKSKLTFKQVDKIRKLIGTATQTKIARSFGVGNATISMIANNKSWTASLKRKPRYGG